MNRRSMLAMLGIGGGAVASGAFVSRATAGGLPPDTHPPRDLQPAGTEVRALFGELAEGAELDRWTVVAVHDVYRGAIPVVLATAAGARFQVDVLRRDHAGLDGVANTPSLSLFLANRGDGSKATDQERGLGAIALAGALANRSRQGAAMPTGLLTLRERAERFPDGAFDVLG